MNPRMKTLIEYSGKLKKKYKRMTLAGILFLILAIISLMVTFNLFPETSIIGFFLFSYVAFVGFCLLIIGLGKMNQIKKNKQKNFHTSLEHFSPEEIQLMNQQTGSSRSNYYQKLQLCLTDDYLICGYPVLVIIPYKEIGRVYINQTGIWINALKQWVIETLDGNKHYFNFQQLKRNEQIEVLELLISHTPNAVYGTPKHVMDINASLSRTKEAKQILRSAAFTAGRVMDLYTSDLNAESNIGLGIIGAFMGSLLLGVVWVVVSMLGYICGWIGYFMLRSAMKGYRLFSKKLDRTGAVLSILITAIMLFTANWFSLSLNISTSFGIPLSAAFVKMYIYLILLDQTHIFWINLAIGYGLSAVVCAGTIKDILTKVPEK